MRSQGFPKSFRIRKRPDFLRVQRRGRREVCKDFVAVSSIRRGDGSSAVVRVGFTVSKKVGNAVTRNLVKRRLREAVRHAWPLFDGLAKPVDIVLIARASAAVASSSALQEQVHHAFLTIARWTNAPSGRRSRSRRR